MAAKKKNLRAVLILLETLTNFAGIKKPMILDQFTIQEKRHIRMKVIKMVKVQEWWRDERKEPFKGKQIKSPQSKCKQK